MSSVLEGRLKTNYENALNEGRKVLIRVCNVLLNGTPVLQKFNLLSNTQKKKCFLDDQKRKIESGQDVNTMDISLLDLIINIFGGLPPCRLLDLTKQMKGIRNNLAHELHILSLDKATLRGKLNVLKTICTAILEELKVYCNPALIPCLDQDIIVIGDRLMKLEKTIDDDILENMAGLVNASVGIVQTTATLSQMTLDSEQATAILGQVVLDSEQATASLKQVILDSEETTATLSRVTLDTEQVIATLSQATINSEQATSNVATMITTLNEAALHCMDIVALTSEETSATLCEAALQSEQRIARIYQMAANVETSLKQFHGNDIELKKDQNDAVAPTAGMQTSQIHYLEVPPSTHLQGASDDESVHSNDSHCTGNRSYDSHENRYNSYHKQHSYSSHDGRNWRNELIMEDEVDGDYNYSHEEVIDEEDIDVKVGDHEDMECIVENKPLGSFNVDDSLPSIKLTFNSLIINDNRASLFKDKIKFRRVKSCP